MTPETINVGAELAALNFYLTQAARRRDDWEDVLTVIPMHPDAVKASALEVPCPDCKAVPGEECRPDCSSYWDR